MTELLGGAELVAFLATADAERARAFFEGTLGLAVIEDTPFALVLDGGGVTVRVQKVERVTTPSGTALGWAVPDVAAVARAPALAAVVPGDAAEAIPEPSAHPKALGSLGRLVEHLDAADVGAARTGLAEAHERGDGIRGALEGGLDGAVGTVADPTVDAARPGLLAGRVAEEDALHAPVDDHAAADSLVAHATSVPVSAASTSAGPGGPVL